MRIKLIELLAKNGESSELKWYSYGKLIAYIDKLEDRIHELEIKLR